MRSPVLSLVALAIFLSAASGLIYENPDDLPTLEYDYIIVGVCSVFPSCGATTEV